MVHLIKNHVTNPKCINKQQGTWTNNGYANVTRLDSGKYQYTLPTGVTIGGIALGTFNDLKAERIVVFRVLESLDNPGIESSSVVEQFDEHTIAVKTSDSRYDWEPFLYLPSTGYTLDWVCSFTPDDYQMLRASGLTYFDGDTMPKIE